MSPVIGRPALLREHNRALILSALRRADALSRADLARDIGLAVPTVSRLVDELTGDGLIEEYGAAHPKAGRPATLLQLRADGACVLGADLGRQGIRVVVADLRARVLADAEYDRGSGPEEDIRIVAEGAGRLLAEVSVDRSRLVGMGIGVPGPLDSRRGLVLDPPNLPGWSFVPVRDRLTALLGIPVVVDNNATVATYGEYLFCHHDVRTMVYVHAGAGVGAGMVLDGHLYRGRANAVGALGHCTVDASGPECSCGRVGCVEALASTGAVVAGYAAAAGVADTEVDFASVREAEDAGRAEATEALARGGRALGLGLGNLVNLVDPELVVLGGPAAGSSAYLEAAVAETRRRTFARTETDIRIERSGLGGQAVALGAAAVMLQQIFESPLATTAER